MKMTMVVTSDVEARYRGFLASAMLEVSAGVYVAPRLSAAVRDRVWNVMNEWYETLGRGSIVMVWQDKNASGGLQLRYLGTPPKEIVDADGILLMKRL